VKVIQAFDDEVLLGIVISTAPPEGGPVSKEGTVTVTVSKGPRMTEIPVVIGIAEVDALGALSRVGFPKPNTPREYSDTVRAGDVISVSPEQGGSVRHDTVLTLVISDGPAPITFPNILGSSEETAMALLTDQYGLVVTVERGRTDAYPEGQVYKQDPVGDETGFRTDSITIWVSEGPLLVEVPYFSGMNEALARATAEDIGLEVTVSDRWLTFCSAICGQSIAPGEEVEVGTVVDLWY
jgi:serine/threonine-protein kinase